jgi:hypothetical protein
MTSSSLASMHIQLRTLTFHYRLEKQIQECLRLKKFTTSLSAAIRELGSPLGPHPESDLVTNIYFGSTPIAHMDESDRRVSFNLHNKFATSLTMAIGALASPLGPHLESELATDLYSSSTPIANIDKSDRRISFNRLNKSMISLSPTIGHRVLH